MKKIFHVMLAALAIISLSPATAHAAGAPAPVSSAEYEHVCYIETVITDTIPDSNTVNALSRSQTITKTKTNYYKNASGETMWYVAVTATFTYDGNTATCTSCSHQAESYASTWSIKSCTSSRSGNSATATAVATQTGISGISHDYTQSVTIQCSPTGEVS